MIKIAPSILSADFSNLENEIEKICKSSADYIHIDVMDGHFVPNLTIGPMIIKSIKKHSSTPFDVHLMIDRPEDSYMDYINAGADILTFHLEATNDPLALMNHIKKTGCKLGISLMPASNIEAIFPYLHLLDLVLIMTVQPGFGGQEYMMEGTEKITEVKKRISEVNKDAIISVDGGINAKTALIAAKAGANMLVSGSYLFSQKNFAQAVLDLKTII